MSSPPITTFHDFFPFPSINPSAFCLSLVALIISLWKLHKARSSTTIFLVDFSCYKPPASQSCTRELLLEKMKLNGHLSEECLNFLRTRLEKSGLGQSTYVPLGLLETPPNICMEEARKESELALFGAIDELLGKTGVKSKDIGTVIVNCSVFNSVPSLCSMIVNRYKLGDDALTYNISGMGCSAGLVAIGLAKNLLQVHRNSYAMVVSTENITRGAYFGSDPSKLVSYCFFRVGASAILLSNHLSDHRNAKYQLVHTVHNNTSSSDRSLNCVLHGEDSEGHVGLSITRDLMPVAAQSIENHLAALGRKILPVAEKVRYITNRVAKIEPYVPNFRKGFDHLCLHVGGKLVLDGLERQLKLSEEDMEASRMTLYRFGNTSSSSVWYAMSYSEAKGKIKEGDRVWQMAYGTGFKCSSVIWRAIKNVDLELSNPWSDEIHGFPVEWHVKPVKMI